MKGFKVTIKTADGEVLDELECDCIVGAVHVTDSEDYLGLFYADCTDAEALRTLRAAMQKISEVMQDEDIQKAMEEDDAAIEAYDPKDLN